MFPIGTIEVINAYRQDRMYAADDHRRAHGLGDAMTRPFRRIPSLRER